MRKYSKIAILLIVSIIATGCSTKSPKVSNECLVSGEPTPLWVCKPFIDQESYAVVGEAKRAKELNLNSYGYSREKALRDAHIKLQKLVGEADISFTKEVDMWISRDGNMYLLVGIPKSLVE